jgi:hypothetical protein
MGLKTKGVFTFLLIAFGLAWGSIFVARFVLDLSLVNPLVQLPVAFSPAIAAVIDRASVGHQGRFPRRRAQAACQNSWLVLPSGLDRSCAGACHDHRAGRRPRPVPLGPDPAAAAHSWRRAC